MNFRVVFFVIAFTIMIMGSVLFFVVSGGAKSAQIAVLDSSSQATLENQAVVRGLFELGDPSFFSLNHSCTHTFGDEAYITLITHYHNPPRTCTIFVNERLTNTHRNLRPDCIRECPNEAFSRTLFIDYLDVRDNHDVRVCCDDVCIRKTLPALCS